MGIMHGIDVNQLEDFSKYAADNPNDVLLGIEASTIWEGTGGAALAKIGPWELGGNRIEKPTRDFSIQFGAWKEVEEALGFEGASDKVEAVEAALAAMCACVTTAVAINAAREGLDFDGIEITAKAAVDPRVLLGILPEDEARSCLQSVDMDIVVTGDDVTDEDRARIKGMAARSPVASMVKYANNLNTNVT